MAGHVTVRVELDDGTVVEQSRHWTGGNRAYDGIEAQAAAEEATNRCRKAIDATHGTIQNPASSPMNHAGRGL